MRRLVPGIAVLALIVAAMVWSAQRGSLNPGAIRDYIRSFGGMAVGVFIAAYALNTVSVFPPIAPLSLSAGLAFGAVRGGIYLGIAAMIGTSATFFISRYAGRRFVEKTLKGRGRDFDARLGKNGFATVLFFRLVPLLPYEFLNYACGLSSMRFRDYFWATLAGIAPGVAAAAYFGGRLGEVRGVRDLFMPQFLIAAGVMALVISVPLAYRYGRKTFNKPR